MPAVALYLDFISPYTWLALHGAESFAAEHGVEWRVEPVVYGALLNSTGLVGPVETPAKRRYTFDDVARCAQRMGLQLVGPPAHPFRSLEALRAMSLFRSDPGALELARAIADAAWMRGADLTRVEVLAEVIGATGRDVSRLGERVAAPETKAALIAGTERALAAGVFGVPTFEWEGELFWGHDRLPHLAERLAGRLDAPRAKSAALIERPAGVQRER